MVVILSSSLMTLKVLPLGELVLKDLSEVEGAKVDGAFVMDGLTMVVVGPRLLVVVVDVDDGRSDVKVDVVSEVGPLLVVTVTPP